MNESIHIYELFDFRKGQSYLKPFAQSSTSVGFWKNLLFAPPNTPSQTA